MAPRISTLCAGRDAMAAGGSMDTYRVQHKTATEHCYYTLAASKAEAVERVTLAIEDAEGETAWTAEPDTPAFSIAAGSVHDRHGKPIKTLEL